MSSSASLERTVRKFILLERTGEPGRWVLSSVLVPSGLGVKLKLGPGRQCQGVKQAGGSD